jgi:hypothetical protein
MWCIVIYDVHGSSSFAEPEVKEIIGPFNTSDNAQEYIDTELKHIHDNDYEFNWTEVAVWPLTPIEKEKNNNEQDKRKEIR